MLSRLVKAGFMINVGKSKFLVNKVKLLGFQVGNGCVEPNFKKL